MPEGLVTEPVLTLGLLEAPHGEHPEEAEVRQRGNQPGPLILSRSLPPRLGSDFAPGDSEKARESSNRAGSGVLELGEDDLNLTELRPQGGSRVDGLPSVLTDGG